MQRHKGRTVNTVGCGFDFNSDFRNFNVSMKVRNGSVLMEKKCVNTRFPGSPGLTFIGRKIILIHAFIASRCIPHMADGTSGSSTKNIRVRIVNVSR